MNEKLKEFAAQAGFNLSWDYHCDEYELERFAELVRDDERAKCASDYLQDCTNAIETARLEEREACAKLCDDWFASTAGRAIRERGLT